MTTVYIDDISQISQVSVWLTGRRLSSFELGRSSIKLKAHDGSAIEFHFLARAPFEAASQICSAAANSDFGRATRPISIQASAQGDGDPALAEEPAVRRQLEIAAFVRGFMFSQEGFNGECAFPHKAEIDLPGVHGGMSPEEIATIAANQLFPAVHQ